MFCFVILLLLDRLIGLEGRVFAKMVRDPGFSPTSRHTKDFEMVLDAPLPNTQQ